MNPTLVNIVFGTLAGLMIFLAVGLVFISLGDARDANDAKVRNRLRAAAAILAGMAGALTWSMGGTVGVIAFLAAVGMLLLLGACWLRAYGDKAGW